MLSPDQIKVALAFTAAEFQAPSKLHWYEPRHLYTLAAYGVGRVLRIKFLEIGGI